MHLIQKIFALVAFSGLVISCNNDTAESNQIQNNSKALSRTATPKRYLFDATKAQTAGNADWVICENSSGTPLRYPSPAQTSITTSTPETYWRGGISAWGVALAKEGHYVETLAPGAAITYGSTTNAQDLSKFDVYVIDEPNTAFTAAEKTAIINFVKNGGGLFLISDHNNSDRNNDGKDSPMIINDLFTNNSVQANPFGLAVELTNYSETSSNVLNDATNTILNGMAGAVTQLKYSAGASIKVTTSANSSAKGLIWKTGLSRTSTTGIMAASATYFNGRVFLLADSSPADDGTGNPSDTLYAGWTEVGGNHARLHLNASYWLAKLQ